VVQLEAWALSKSPANTVHFEAVTANVYLVKGSIRIQANTLCSGLIRNESRCLHERLERQLAHFRDLHVQLLTPPKDTAQLSALSAFVKEVEGNADDLRAEVLACRRAFDSLEAHGAGLTDELVAAMWGALGCLLQLRVRLKSIYYSIIADPVKRNSVHANRLLDLNTVALAPACRRAFEETESHGAGLTDELVAVLSGALGCLSKLRVRFLPVACCWCCINADRVVFSLLRGANMRSAWKAIVVWELLQAVLCLLVLLKVLWHCDGNAGRLSCISYRPTLPCRMT
jgi:hypothetical protein